MGRSASNPLPPILNNKFDALPPAEGLVFDFVFDFKVKKRKHSLALILVVVDNAFTAKSFI